MKSVDVCGGLILIHKRGRWDGNGQWEDCDGGKNVR